MSSALNRDWKYRESTKLCEKNWSIRRKKRLKQSKKLRTPFWNWIELEIHCRQHCRVVLFTIQLVKYDANNPTMSSIKKREQEKKTSNKKKTNETKENRNNGRHFEFGRPFDEPMAGSPVVLVDNLPFFFKKKLFFFAFSFPFSLLEGNRSEKLVIIYEK